MELKVFWRTLRRRWYLTLVVLALTVGSTVYVVGAVGPTSEAEGSVLVFPPASSIREEGGATKTIGNPYLELAGVAQARDVIIRTLKSRTVQLDWGEAFPGMSFEATPDFTNSAPIILFTVEGKTPTGATEALDDLMARVPIVLYDLQEGLGLNQDGLVTARNLTQDARPAIVRKTQIRAAVLAVAVTGGLGLLLLALIESLLAMRARGKAEEESATDPRTTTADRADAPVPVATAARDEKAAGDAKPVEPMRPTGSTKPQALSSRGNHGPVSTRGEASRQAFSDRKQSATQPGERGELDAVPGPKGLRAGGGRG